MFTYLNKSVYDWMELCYKEYFFSKNELCSRNKSLRSTKELAQWEDGEEIRKLKIQQK